MFGGEPMTNLLSDNSPVATKAEKTNTILSGQSVLDELRALGLDVAFDEAKAMRIKGGLRIIEGRSQQGDYGGVAQSLDWRQLFAACYHAVALEVVDADSTSETLKETIPCFLSEYFRSRKWTFWQKEDVDDFCEGALLEWQGKLLRLAAERTSTLSSEQTEEARNNERARRQRLLHDYQQQTGASNREIYEGYSGICKPDFYRWRKGDLPIISKTTQKFERFLRAGKRPLPRRPNY